MHPFCTAASVLPEKHYIACNPVYSNKIDAGYLPIIIRILILCKNYKLIAPFTLYVYLVWREKSFYKLTLGETLRRHLINIEVTINLLQNRNSYATVCKFEFEHSEDLYKV